MPFTTRARARDPSTLMPRHAETLPCSRVSFNLSLSQGLGAACLTDVPELMKEYRRIDDSVTMRLNRTVAMFRERERPGVSSQMASPEQEGCAYFWQDLTGVLGHLLPFRSRW